MTGREACASDRSAETWVGQGCQVGTEAPSMTELTTLGANYAGLCVGAGEAHVANDA